MSSVVELNEKKGFGFYWKFYWPLTLMGVSLILSRQFQNGILARYPNAVQEIAIFAIASSINHIFLSCFAFVPQMANVMVKGRLDFHFSKKFILFITFVQFFMLLLATNTSVGHSLLKGCFNLSDINLSKVVFYLRMFMPLLFIQSLSQLYTGLLIKNKFTGVVTFFDILHLSCILGLLIIGYSLQLNVVLTLVGSQVTAKGLLFVASVFKFKKSCVLEDQAEATVNYKELWAFFWPIALTSSMFSLTRPVLYSFVSRIPNSEMIIAALRLSFDFSMVFQNMINQFRHVFITFSGSDSSGVRSFLLKVIFLISVIMMLFVGFGALEYIFISLMKVDSEVSQMANEVFWVLCFIPVIVGVRNYFHGVFMVNKTTLIMGVGGIVRVGSTILITWLFVSAGYLNHVTAGFCLVMGFTSETMVNAVKYYLNNDKGLKG